MRECIHLILISCTLASKVRIVVYVSILVSCAIYKEEHTGLDFWGVFRPPQTHYVPEICDLDTKCGWKSGLSFHLDSCMFND